MKEEAVRRQSIEEARNAFPSGLEQPEGSFRFSRDALLLADLAAEQPLPDEATVAELGTGCGVVSLALLLKKSGLHAVGLERESVLVDAASRNAAALGLGENFRPFCGDVCSHDDLRRMRESLRDGAAGRKSGEGALPMFDMVVANPPWRVAGSGRVPPSELRRRALFGAPDTFERFASAADALLKSGGLYAVVVGADRTAELLASLPSRLHPELMRFVFTKEGAPAEFVLLLARKNGHAALRIEKA